MTALTEDELKEMVEKGDSSATFALGLYQTLHGPVSNCDEVIRGKINK